MRKNYILDTSVLVHDNNCIKVFEDNNVIIPIAVLEELDHLKTRSDSVGANARIAIKNIDKHCECADISNGIPIENNITLFIDVKNTKDPKFNANNKDDSILACASSYKDAVLVSKDINMRVRAKAFNIKAEDYNNDKVTNVGDLYMGYREISLNNEDELICDNIEGTVFESLYPNECVQVDVNGKKSIFRRINNSLVPIRIPPLVFGLKSRNREQAFALDLLLDKNVPLVTIAGPAGTGKTLIAIASALESVIERKTYSKVEIYKPIQTVGKDIGFLPGTMDEKLSPWMGSVYDALESLLGESYERKLEQYAEKIKIEAIAYIRGRSINNSIMLIEECQNLTRSELKTILSRAGTSKVILDGDFSQIDSPYLDASNNGFTYVIDCFKKSNLAGHITLTKGERSPLATEAANIL